MSDVTYNHRLEMTGQVLGNNLTQIYSYYPASGSYRLSGTNLKVTNSSVSRFNRSYQYDPVGNITQIVTGLQGQSQETQTFSYDSLNRLKTAQAAGGPAPYNHTGSNDYDYDAIGNITSLAGSSSYNYTSWHNNCGPTTPPQPLPHAVKQIGSDYYCYDNNGNMTTRKMGSTTYTQSFDVENRLIQVTASGSSQVTQFAYDASGQRLRTLVETPGVSRTITTYPFPQYEVEQQFTWQYLCLGDELGGPVCNWQWGLTNTIIRRTYMLGGQAVATRITGDPTNNGLFYLHGDHLGSTSLLAHLPQQPREHGTRQRDPLLTLWHPPPGPHHPTH